MHPVETRLGSRKELLLQIPQYVRAVGDELDFAELFRPKATSNRLLLEPHKHRAIRRKRRVDSLVDWTGPAVSVVVEIPRFRGHSV